MGSQKGVNMGHHAFLAVTLFPPESTRPVTLAAGRYATADELVHVCLRHLHGMPKQNYTHARIVVEPLVRPKGKPEPRGRSVRRDDSIYDVIHAEAARYFDVPKD